MVRRGKYRPANLLPQIYIALVDLELYHDNIRKEGYIIAYEKKTETPNRDTLYQEGSTISGASWKGVGSH